MRYVDVMTTSDVCAELGVSRRTVMTWKAQGKIAPEGKVGPGMGMLVWDPAKVARWRKEFGRG
jgi:DNA-binding transcriptional MerR regulator